MYTILQEANNKIVIPYDGTDYDYLLIVFEYSCYQSVGIFENTAPSKCDYEIIVQEVGSEGTSDPENGQVKISPRSTWVMSVYGQDDNINLFPAYASLIDVYKAQVKGETCNVYPNDSPSIVCAPATAVLLNTVPTELSSTEIASGESQNITAPDATAVVKDQQGNTLATVNIPSGVTQEIVVEGGQPNLPPNAPTEPIVTNITETTALLSWTAATDN